jgi:hypothetical protein
MKALVLALRFGMVGPSVTDRDPQVQEPDGQGGQR